MSSASSAHAAAAALMIVADTTGFAGSSSASPQASPDRAAQAPRPADRPVGPLPGPGERRLQPMANPYGGDEAALQQGRRFFVAYNCAGCHGDHGGGGMGPSLRDEAWIYGGSDADIADSILEGRAYGMPAWGRMLTQEQVWQIAAYLKAMRTPHEPDPPVGS